VGCYVKNILVFFKKSLLTSILRASNKLIPDGEETFFDVVIDAVIKQAASLFGDCGLIPTLHDFGYDFLLVKLEISG
jgi:hypothetical protein